MSSPLFGALEADVQDRAIAPAPKGRRKIVLATSIAETSLTIEGVRIVIDCGLSRVPRYEPDVGLDAARNRAGVARVGRPAARPRRPHRARRLLSAVGRAADRLARRLQHAGDSRRRSVEPGARSRALGRRPIPASSTSSIRRRAPAWSEANALLAELGAHRRRRPHHRRGQRRCGSCRCRRASRAWWSTRRRAGEAELAADIAAVLTERGLGGNDVDLTHRLDDVAARSLAPRRRTRARWRSGGRSLRKERQRRCGRDGSVPSPRHQRVHARPATRYGGGEGLGVGGGSIEGKAPPTPDPSPPFAARMGGGGAERPVAR